MRKNAEWVLQFHSEDDHLVPVEEARHVHEQVRLAFFSHFLIISRLELNITK